jgi:hypothetical protein
MEEAGLGRPQSYAASAETFAALVSPPGWYWHNSGPSTVTARRKGAHRCSWIFS